MLREAMGRRNVGGRCNRMVPSEKVACRKQHAESGQGDVGAERLQPEGGRDADT
jgi:hypothetical protein